MPKLSEYDKWSKSGELKDILIKIRKWRRYGLTIDDIADKLNIDRSTFYRYQKKYEDICDALKKGKEVCDAEIEESLLKECIGYTFEESTTVKTAIIDKKTGQVTNLEKVEMKTHKKYARPNVTAIAYYLNNRDANNWKQRNDISVSDDNGILPKLIEALNEEKST